MDQIIDISTDGRFLSKEHGFLKVSEDATEIGRVPFDQIAGIIVHSHGITWSNSLLAELGLRGIPVVICSKNHFPVSAIFPIEGHHLQGARLRAQWKASLPLSKQAWREIIKSKIRMQVAILEANGVSAEPIKSMINDVNSGDSKNVEAKVAQRYWPALMGRNFRRNPKYCGINAQLNYGYTVLRATTARAIIAAGLHPTVSLHHSNQYNAFALCDDLMEPFRPIVDTTVLKLSRLIGQNVTSDIKKKLVQLIALDLPLGDNKSPISVALMKLSTSLAQSFIEKKLSLILPRPPDKETISNLGK